MLGLRLVTLNALGSAGIFCIRGLWLAGFVALGVAASVALLPAAWRFLGSWADAWREAVAPLRGPPPQTWRPELHPVPRPRAYGQPPWVTAEMPAIGHAASCPAMASMMPDGLCRCGVSA